MTLNKKKRFSIAQRHCDFSLLRLWVFSTTNDAINFLRIPIRSETKIKRHNEGSERVLLVQVGKQKPVVNAIVPRDPSTEAD